MNSCKLLSKLLKRTLKENLRRLKKSLSPQGDLIYIWSMLNYRSVKLLTIYIALHKPLCNIFLKKEKYHKFQLCGTYVISYSNFKNII